MNIEEIKKRDIEKRLKECKDPEWIAHYKELLKKMEG